MHHKLTTTAKIRFSDCDPIGHLNNVKYLEYMLNAREDHVENFYGYTYEDYTKKTGCTWITIQTQIAYLKEVRYNTKVDITSKTIEVGERVSTIEIVMVNPETDIVYAVMWMQIIYFNLKTRKSEVQPAEVIEMLKKAQYDIDVKDFQSRVQQIRKNNKNQ